MYLTSCVSRPPVPIPFSYNPLRLLCWQLERTNTLYLLQENRLLLCESFVKHWLRAPHGWLWEINYPLGLVVMTSSAQTAWHCRLLTSCCLETEQKKIDFRITLRFTSWSNRCSCDKDRPSTAWSPAQTSERGFSCSNKWPLHVLLQVCAQRVPNMVMYVLCRIMSGVPCGVGLQVYQERTTLI